MSEPTPGTDPVGTVRRDLLAAVEAHLITDGCDFCHNVPALASEITGAALAVLVSAGLLRNTGDDGCEDTAHEFPPIPRRQIKIEPARDSRFDGGIRATHLPTGKFTECCTSDDPDVNEMMARHDLRELVASLDLDTPTPLQPGEPFDMEYLATRRPPVGSSGRKVTLEELGGGSDA